MKRRLPNILISGTPGTGKSTLSSEICEQAGLEWINIGELAKTNNLFEDYDDTLQCHVLDEDRTPSFRNGGPGYEQGTIVKRTKTRVHSQRRIKNSSKNKDDFKKVISELEDKMLEGGKIVDYHGCDFFPESWFDIVFVLTTDNTILYDRLVRRGYNEVKIKNNIEAEIFQTLLDEAKSSYPPHIVHKLTSNTPDDMEANIEQICQWIELFKNNGAVG